MKKILVLVVVTLVMSCASKVEFPVSNVTPGAEIKANISKDENGNTEIDLRTKYLTNPTRLSPPRNVYLVWLKTNDNGVVNLGQLKTNSSSKANFRTITPYEVSEVFITAENDVLIKHPTGEEITRAKIN